MSSNKVKKKYKLKVNSIPKLEELLQELYNESNKIITEVQEQINKLVSSVNLNDEPMDAKAKYSKAMNDFLNTKDKAIGRKLDIAKLMSDIVKFNGNVTEAVNNNTSFDWEDLKDKVDGSFSFEETNSPPEEYQLNIVEAKKK